LPAAEVAKENQSSGDLALLRDAAVEAGRIAMRFFRKSPEVWMKDGTSPVSAADYAVDRFLRDALLAARPDYGWLSEETADSAARLSARKTFVVDPIDGTRGFLEGQNAWCVSVAIVEGGRSLAGALECPARDETYWAQQGVGAFRNGAAIRVRAVPDDPEIAGHRNLIDALTGGLSSRARRHQYVPSLAYRLAMIAEGRLDATFVKANAHDWDLAAADLILHEAGGGILNAARVRPTYAGVEISHGPLVAGSGDLLERMADVIA
jgi:myo-inositol-1(or 4)-monophosphatase